MERRELSGLSIDELLGRIKQAEADGDLMELEALKSELQRRMDLFLEAWGDFTEKIRKFFEVLYQTGMNLVNAMRAPFLIKQYEQEIQRVEQLLKYTRHSKKRRKHEQYLKCLYKRLDDFRTL